MAADPQPPRRGLANRMIDAVISPLVQPVVDAVDLDDVVERIDINALLDDVDINSLLDRIDVDPLLDRIDVNALLDRIDVDRLLDRIDVDSLLGRIDVDGLVGRLDVDGLMGRVDMDQLLERVDVNAVFKRTELGEVIARSTTGVFGQLLDVVRAAVMTLDATLHALIGRILRRDRPGAQRRPDDDTAYTEVRDLQRMDRAVAMQGHYAGGVSRFFAFLVDASLGGALYAGLVGLMTLALETLAGIEINWNDHRWLVTLSYLAWQFLYLALPTAVAGRTVGKAVLGVFVVRRDGSRVAFRGAALRTLALPLSFLLFGVGFLFGLLRRDRRTLHDLIGGTAVVYAWDAEVARVRAGTLSVTTAA